MNRYFIICFLLIGLQSSFAQRFRAGLVAGLVSTDLAGVDPYDNDFHKAGFTAGGILNAKLSDKNSFQFEILYTQKGSLQPADSLNNFNYFQLNLNYIEVPLLFIHKFTFNVNKKPIKGFASEVGISLGALSGISQNNNTFYGIPDNKQFRNNEVAANIGFSYTIIDNLSLNVRYSNSIIPVVKNAQLLNGFFWYTFNKGNNMVFYFSLRYIFKTSESKE